MGWRKCRRLHRFGSLFAKDQLQSKIMINHLCTVSAINLFCNKTIVKFTQYIFITINFLKENAFQVMESLAAIRDQNPNEHVLDMRTRRFRKRAVTSQTLQYFVETLVLNGKTFYIMS